MTRRGNWFGLPAGLVVFSLAAATGFSAEATEHGGIFSITDENDAWSNFFGPHQDRHYTHGIKLAYLGGDDAMTNLTGRLDDLFAWGHQPLPGNFGFVAGQDM